MQCNSDLVVLRFAFQEQPLLCIEISDSQAVWKSKCQIWHFVKMKWSNKNKKAFEISKAFLFLLLHFILTKCQIWHFDFQTAWESLISMQSKGCSWKAKRKTTKSLLHCMIAKSLQKFYAKICWRFLLFPILFALSTESSKLCFRNHAWFPP